MSGSQKAVAAGLLAGLGQGMVDVAKQKTETADKVILMEAERMHAEGLARLKNQWDKENLKTEHDYRIEGVKLDQAGNLAVEQVRSQNERGLLDTRIEGERDLQATKQAGDVALAEKEAELGKWQSTGTDNEGRRLNWQLNANIDEMSAISKQVTDGVIKRDVGAQRIKALEADNVQLRAALSGNPAPSAEPAAQTPAPAAAEAAVRKDPKLADQFKAKYGYLPEGL